MTTDSIQCSWGVNWTTGMVTVMCPHIYNSTEEEKERAIDDFLAKNKNTPHYIAYMASQAMRKNPDWGVRIPGTKNHLVYIPNWEEELLVPCPDSYEPQGNFIALDGNTGLANVLIDGSTTLRLAARTHDHYRDDCAERSRDYAYDYHYDNKFSGRSKNFDEDYEDYEDYIPSQALMDAERRRDYCVWCGGTNDPKNAELRMKIAVSALALMMTAYANHKPDLDSSKYYPVVAVRDTVLANPELAAFYAKN